MGLKGFGPSSLDIEFWGYFKVYAYRAQVEAQHAFVGDIIEWARKVGVSFAFPTRTVHVASSTNAVPNASTLSGQDPAAQ